MNPKHHRKNNFFGFTLLEVILVCGLIAIVAAISIPLLSRSRMVANETSAIMSLRTILVAQSQFRLANPRYGDLTELNEGGYLSNPLGKGEKSGYLFQALIEGTGKWTWYAEAIPKVYNYPGVKSFYIDETNVMRIKDTGDSAFVTRAEAQTWPVISE